MAFNDSLRRKFENRWKKYYIFIPPLDIMPPKYYERLKEFAWNVYKDSSDPNYYLTEK